MMRRSGEIYKEKKLLVFLVLWLGRGERGKYLENIERY